MPKTKGSGLDRWATLNRFVDEYQADLTRTTGSASAAAVWLALFRWADGNKGGKVKRISNVELAAMTGLDRDTVGAAIGVLIERDYLTVEQPGGRGRAAVYRLTHVEKSPTS